LLSLSSSAWHF